jgi:hypothetical protein
MRFGANLSDRSETPDHNPGFFSFLHPIKIQIDGRVQILISLLLFGEMRMPVPVVTSEPLPSTHSENQSNRENLTFDQDTSSLVITPPKHLLFSSWSLVFIPILFLGLGYYIWSSSASSSISTPLVITLAIMATIAMGCFFMVSSVNSSPLVIDRDQGIRVENDQIIPIQEIDGITIREEIDDCEIVRFSPALVLKTGMTVVFAPQTWISEGSYELSREVAEQIAEFLGVRFADRLASRETLVDMDSKVDHLAPKISEVQGNDLNRRGPSR